jgi:hypothetical protein
MFVVQISLLIVTFLSLISQISIINANHQRCQPTPSHCVMCQYVECHLLLLLRCWCMHMSHRPGRPSATLLKCCTLCYFIASVTCYTNSMASCIHVNTIKFHNITCTLVAISVILRGLECTYLCILYFDNSTLSPSHCLGAHSKLIRMHFHQEMLMPPWYHLLLSARVHFLGRLS